MTRFLPAWIFSIFVLFRGFCAVRLGSRASPFVVQMGIPRVKKDQARYEEAVRGLKGPFGAKVETRT
jgi:hypothetical protein